jgi:hypothetical protein
MPPRIRIGLLSRVPPLMFFFTDSLVRRNAASSVSPMQRGIAKCTNDPLFGVIYGGMFLAH